jgi:hypothetical protein
LESKRNAFKALKSLEEVEKELQPNEYIKFSIFDKVKVKVETTTEFPLDLKCSLMFSQDDIAEYGKILEEQNLKQVEAKVVEVAVIQDENLNDEV